MDNFDFSADSPSRLMVESEPEELFRAAKRLPCWTARALEVADAALAYWASNALASQRNREGIGEIRGLIRRLQVIQPPEQQDTELDVAGYYRQWNGMVAVLDARAHLLDCHRDIAAIEARAHMKELRAVLQEAGEEGLSTQALQERLDKLSKARMSQVLALAEAAGLVERRKVGQRKFVGAAGAWRPAPKSAELSAIPGNAKQEFSDKRGLHLLAA